MLHRFAVHSKRAAYFALVFLTLIWGANWLVMKLALQRADPIVYNIQRTLVAVVALFAVMLWQRRRLLPQSWRAVIITGFFQTTINFASTTMALVDGGAGRTSVLVFTMPFWTMLLAWPVLGERVRGGQWFAVAFALVGLTLVVEPWNWHDALRPKLWAVLSGFGWAAGTIATKYFQREKHIDMLNFIAWQMLVGVVPFFAFPLVYPVGATDWSVIYVLLLIYIGAVSTAFGFVLWIAVLRLLPAGTASLNMLAIPVIALLTSMAVFDERLSWIEWTGIACVGVGLAIVSIHAWHLNRMGRAAVVEAPPLEGG
jgi:drug/metabolite transporter (DMT)-like permease